MMCTTTNIAFKLSDDIVSNFSTAYDSDADFATSAGESSPCSSQADNAISTEFEDSWISGSEPNTWVSRFGEVELRNTFICDRSTVSETRRATLMPHFAPTAVIAAPVRTVAPALPSKGSARHPHMCMPCRFFNGFIPGQPCLKGEDCTFCHCEHGPSRRKGGKR